VKFRMRRRFRLGPLYINLTQRGFSSWGLKIGPWTWNATTAKHSVDTPGPGSFHSRGHRRHRRT